MGNDEWEWDPSLYTGSAEHYVHGRVPYPHELVGRLASELELDGEGRLLDVGCGPGSLTLLLAGWFEQAIGVDADPGMLAEARKQADERGIDNAEWVNLRAEAVSPDLGTFRVATLAQSFHWMDQALVARLIRSVLSDDGYLVVVHATTHQGIESDAPLPDPRPPRRDIDALIQRFLGPHRRAGKGTRPESDASEAELGTAQAELLRAAGFDGPTRIDIPGRLVIRQTDDIVASVFSLSSSTPHLFGDRRHEFEAELRDLLRDASPSGRFSEQMRESGIDIWRVRPAGQ